MDEAAVLLRELSETAGVQFVLVTHKDELLDAADVVYRTRLEDGQTKFTLEHDLDDAAYHRRPKRGERGRAPGSPFDGQDLSGNPGDDLEVVHSETDDVLARRQRKQAELRAPEIKKRKAKKVTKRARLDRKNEAARLRRAARRAKREQG